MVAVPAAQGQSSCVPLAGNVRGVNPGDNWVGEGWWSFGNAAPQYGTTFTVNTGVELNEEDVATGTELTTLDFGYGDTFQLVTRWVVHHGSNPSGNAEVTEIGTIANGTGRFQNVYGVYYSPGVVGPATATDWQTFIWTGSYQGTICGLDATVVSNSLWKSQAIRPPGSRARRAR
jgi:hypothetical protein